MKATILNHGDSIRYYYLPWYSACRLGVLPVIYTAFSSIYTRWRVRRELLMYNIDAVIHTRLMSGFVEMKIPAFELSVFPRSHPTYWPGQSIENSVHGIGSWKNLNWIERPIQFKTLRIYPTDPLRLPEARVEFPALAYYLSDLGYKINPEGFWNLQKYGIKVIPDTCLFYEEVETGRATPVLVVAMPAVENPGSLLLRLHRSPIPNSRGPQSLEPSWIGLVGSTPHIRAESSIYSRTSQELHGPTVTPDGANLEGILPRALIKSTSNFVIQNNTECMYVDSKGITHRRVGNKATPVYGLCFWFTYSLLASTGREGYPGFSYRPTGFRMRLSTLYFARECVIPINGPSWHDKWYALFLGNLSVQKMESIPSEWTEDSPKRRDERLSKRFELLIPDQLRNRSAYFRRRRIQALQLSRDKLGGKISSDATSFIPLEAFEIDPENWSYITKGATSNCLSPLGLEYPPSSQQICSVVCSNEQLGQRIGTILLELYFWFKGKHGLSMLVSEPSHDDMITFLCALIILQSIGDGAPYLATLLDVEECTRVLNPVYLS